jgi:pimeloyl-ACP methyl ester carboxylesterase
MTACDIQRFFVPDPAHSMYVERWSAGDAPPRGNLIFIHGGSHTGVCWTDPPGGETQGWVPWFAEQGWRCFVVDWPGVGRSGFSHDFPTMGAAPVIASLVALLGRIGPSTLVGHSIGATLALRAAEECPELVKAIVGLNPGQPGNIPFAFPVVDEATAFITAAELARDVFAGSQRFPIEHFEEYYASLVPMSPRLFNEVGARRGDGLVLKNTDVVAQRPILLVAAEEDKLVPRADIEALVDLVGADYVLVGRDWELEGFGHLIPIERGTEQLASRALDWLQTAVSPPVVRQGA